MSNVCFVKIGIILLLGRCDDYYYYLSMNVSSMNFVKSVNV